MTELILRRLGLMALTMIIVSLAVFWISEVAPTDVARNILGQYVSEEVVAAYREGLGLNCHWFVRYVIWIIGDDWIPPARELVGDEVLPQCCTPERLDRRGLIRGDLGTSTQTMRPLTPFVSRRLKNSLILAGFALVVIIPTSLLIGVLAGLREGGFLDRFISIMSLLTVSAPSFAIGVVLVVIFCLWLGWLPGISALETEHSVLESPSKLVLPVLVLFFSEVGYVARMTRASVVQVMRQNYIRTAILKGLPRRQVILGHALRNALVAPITVIALHINWLIAGAVVAETLFAYPGIGSALLGAAVSKDVSMIEASVLLMTFLATSTQLLTDILYTYLNPRIRYR